jgi:hypothetical protein
MNASLSVGMAAADRLSLFCLLRGVTSKLICPGESLSSSLSVSGDTLFSGELKPSANR